MSLISLPPSFNFLSSKGSFMLASRDEWKVIWWTTDTDMWDLLLPARSAQIKDRPRLWEIVWNEIVGESLIWWLCEFDLCDPMNDSWSSSVSLCRPTSSQLPVELLSQFVREQQPHCGNDTASLFIFSRRKSILTTERWRLVDGAQREEKEVKCGWLGYK